MHEDGALVDVGGQVVAGRAEPERERRRGWTAAAAASEASRARGLARFTRWSYSLRQSPDAELGFIT